MELIFDLYLIEALKNIIVSVNVYIDKQYVSRADSAT